MDGISSPGVGGGQGGDEVPQLTGNVGPEKILKGPVVVGQLYHGAALLSHILSFRSTHVVPLAKPMYYMSSTIVNPLFGRFLGKDTQNGCFFRSCSVNKGKYLFPLDRVRGPWYYLTQQTK